MELRDCLAYVLGVEVPLNSPDPIESLRKLAALEPSTVAAGHSEPMSGDPAYLRMLLEQAANRG